MNKCIHFLLSLLPVHRIRTDHLLPQECWVFAVEITIGSSGVPGTVHHLEPGCHTLDNDKLYQQSDSLTPWQ